MIRKVAKPEFLNADCGGHAVIPFDDCHQGLMTFGIAQAGYLVAISFPAGAGVRQLTDRSERHRWWQFSVDLSVLA